MSWRRLLQSQHATVKQQQPQKSGRFMAYILVAVISCLEALLCCNVFFSRVVAGKIFEHLLPCFLFYSHACKRADTFICKLTYTYTPMHECIYKQLLPFHIYIYICTCSYISHYVCMYACIYYVLELPYTTTCLTQYKIALTMASTPEIYIRLWTHERHFHTSPLRASYGVSSVSILKKNDHHFIKRFDWIYKVTYMQ